MAENVKILAQVLIVLVQTILPELVASMNTMLVNWVIVKMEQHALITVLDSNAFVRLDLLENSAKKILWIAEKIHVHPAPLALILPENSIANVHLI